MNAKYLSASGLKNYLTCPFKYYKAQVERLRLIVPKAYFAFGKAVHKGIEKKISEKLNPISVFEETWGYEQAADLLYSSKDTHQTLMEQGKTMLEAWQQDITTQKLLEAPALVEKPFFANIDGIPLYGIIDFLSLDVVIDWKTSSSTYGEEKKLDLQLPFYSLLLEKEEDNDSDLMYGYGVITKNKTPKVQYLFSHVNKERKRELKTLISIAWEGILANRFHRIPNSTCSFCDFLPICLNKEGAEKLFVSISKEEEEDEW